MSFLGIGFLAPLALSGLLLLPVIYWLLRIRPPQPEKRFFPPLALLKRLDSHEKEARTTPWWLLVLRLVLFACLVLAVSQPFLGNKARFLAEERPVLLVIDDTWAAAKNWQLRLSTARQILEEASAKGVPVRLMTTASATLSPADTYNAGAALDQIMGLKPAPKERDALGALIRLNSLGEAVKSTSILWLSDGLADEANFAGQLARLAGTQISVFLPKPSDLPKVITDFAFTREGVRLTVSRFSENADTDVEFLNKDNGVILSLPIEGSGFEQSLTQAMPPALQASIARVELKGEPHVGGVWLSARTDQRLKVAVISGGGEKPQPLLVPSHYITSSFDDATDIVRKTDVDFSGAITQALNEGLEALVLNGTGPLPDDIAPTLSRFMEEGGVVIRFADKGLAGAEDPLLPGKPHANLRLFGGQLSWGETPGIGRFSETGILSGIAIDDTVTFRAQLLLSPKVDSAQNPTQALASLTDGTPLITHETRGKGALVFVHVDADPAWSNMASSPSFAAMMQRLEKLSQYQSAVGLARDGLRQPYRLLNGSGNLTQPEQTASAVDFSQAIPKNARPGLYGPEGEFALNFAETNPSLARLALSATAANSAAYPEVSVKNFTPFLLLLAMVLLLLDGVIGLVMSGRLTRFKRGAVAASLGAGLALVALWPAPNAMAQTADAWEASLTPRLGYILTGNDSFDRMANAGLLGLSTVLTNRTALELAEPVGLNLEQDDLGFFQFLYWAVPPEAEPLSATARQSLTRYLRNGGTLLIDTRDENSGFGSNGTSMENLRRVLDDIPIPALSPVADNHVLTRSFYLLQSFPGRFDGGTLWAETALDEPDRLTRTGDNISPILITSNDMAGAWALDAYGKPLLPVVPGGELQREYAYRAGVNMVMYAFTGNYKADQVHLPDILERLGQ